LKTKDEQRLTQDNFWTQVYKRTFEISRSRGTRSPKTKRQSSKPYRWAIRKTWRKFKVDQTMFTTQQNFLKLQDKMYLWQMFH